MDWVKLHTTYDHDLAIAAADDAAEVMFTRALAYCGRAKTGGFIPDSQLHHLTRRPTRARQIVGQLTRVAPDGSPGPLERVEGGYRIRNWDHYQDALVQLDARRKSDRERKQKQRDRDRGRGVTGQSRDSHVESPHTERREEKNTAAAAAADGDLPTSIAILRDRLQANTALQALRFDNLAAEKVTQLEALIAKHGDQRLVDTAVRTLRTPPPVHVSAFLGTWAALPEPGQRFRVVEAECDEHPGKNARTCPACAADRLAGDR